MRFCVCRFIGAPRTRISPESGAVMFMIIRIVVVLPAPLGPSRPNTIPLGTLNERSSTARNRPKLFDTPWSSIVFSICVTATYETDEVEFLRDQRYQGDSGFRGAPKARPSRSAERRYGGEGGIRTPEALSGLPVFETGLINHSSTSARAWGGILCRPPEVDPQQSAAPG